MTSKVSLPAGARFMDAPAGAQLTPARMAAGILALNPNYNPPPGRHQSMAENMIALGEHVLAMNPIRLASTAVDTTARRAKIGGPSVAIPVFPPKIRSRLEPSLPENEASPSGDLGKSSGDPTRGVPLPTSNPTRASMTVAPKGEAPRRPTVPELTQSLPNDRLSDILYKAGQNVGDDLERMADYAMPEVRRKLGDTVGDLAEYGVGYLQTWTPRRQKREGLVDDMREHNKRRYGTPGAFTNHPLTTMFDLNLPNILGFRAYPTISGFIEQRRKREKGNGSPE